MSGSELWTSLSLASFGLAILTIPSVLLNRRGRPISALAWILLLIGVPGLGLISWWLLGRRHLDRKRRKRRVAHERFQRNLAELRENLPETPVARFAALSSKASEDDDGIFPPSSGNSARILVDGHAFFPTLEQAIRGAREHIHLLFYIWQNDPLGREIRDVLALKAREGVKVRALYDSIGSSLLDERFLRPLKRAGAEVRACAPAQLLVRAPTINFRNHRKLLIVDGQRAFIGGLNLGSEYLHDWHDIGVELRGPVLDQLQEVFCDDWFFAGADALAEERLYGRWTEEKTQPEGFHPVSCAVLASGPHQRNRRLRDALFIAITTARTRVWIMTPYFVPDAAVTVALSTAAARGLDVRILVPGRSDVMIVDFAARPYYEDLMRAGVRVFAFDDRAILHGKVVLVDDDAAVLEIGRAHV